MKVCIPIREDRGLDSPVAAHFGSTPLFLIAQTDTMAFEVVANGNKGHAPGQCRPLVPLEGKGVEIVATPGIGLAALRLLDQSGIAVHATDRGTARAVVDELRAGRLARFRAEDARSCSGDGRPG